MSYTDFLQAKAVRAHTIGPTVDPASVHPMLHDWQTEWRGTATLFDTD